MGILPLQEGVFSNMCNSVLSKICLLLAIIGGVDWGFVRIDVAFGTEEYRVFAFGTK